MSNGGNAMKIQNQLLKVTMFTAVLLGASITSQTVKADETTDANATKDATAKSEKTAVPLYNGFKSTDNDVATTEPAASQTNARETTEDNVSSSEDQTTWINTNQFKPQNDYYDYLNHKWINKTDVQSDKMDAGASLDAQRNINQRVQNKFYDYLNGTENTKSQNMQKAMDFYNLYLSKNYSSTEDISKDAAQGIMKVVNQIDSLEDLSDFSKNMNDLLKEGVTMPIGVKVDIDQRNPDLRALYFYGGAPVLLKDNGETNEDQTNQNTIGGFLSSSGLSLSSIQGIVVNASKFDKILVDNQSAEDIITDHYQNNYGAEGINRLGDYLGVNYVNFTNMPVFIDMDHFVNGVTGMTPGYVYEMTPSFYNNINEIMTDENFAEMKAWMICNYVLNSSNYIHNLIANFPEVEGETKAEFNQRMAYYLTTDAFGDAFSKYFGEIFLTKEAKETVTDMAENLVSAYKDTISNSWLEASSKKAALEKLDDMKLNIGYPTDSYSYYNKIDIKDDSDFYQTYRDIVDARNYNQYAKYQKPADRTEWAGLSSLNANAQYVPSKNAIFINTGFLQAPFFDVKASDSTNYGGIGTVIGHELSHGFDQIGSLYDKDGLFKNMWTANDLEKYSEKTAQLSKIYDKTNFQGATISGDTTVNENLADNAGLKVAEKALEKTNAANWDQFYRSYAKANRYKYFIDPDNASVAAKRREQLEKDAHSPFPIRVNKTLQNSDQFDKTYGVKPGDGMWVDPDKRFNLWS